MLAKGNKGKGPFIETLTTSLIDSVVLTSPSGAQWLIVSSRGIPQNPFLGWEGGGRPLQVRTRGFHVAGHGVDKVTKPIIFQNYPVLEDDGYPIGNPVRQPLKQIRGQKGL